MKKLFYAFLVTASSIALAKNSLQDLQETVRLRSIEAKNSYASAHAELCRTESLHTRIMEQAENTRLFLQEFDYCELNPKNRKKKNPTEKPVADINKNIIPAIMKEARAVDRLERSLKQASVQIDKDRGELRKNYVHEDKKTSKNDSDKTSKLMIRLGKSFRAQLDATKSFNQELLGIQTRLIELREKLLLLENPFIKMQKDAAEKKRTQENAQPESTAAPQEAGEKDESWSLTDWINSIFNSEKPDAIETKKQANKAKFIELKKKRKSIEQQMAKIKPAKTHAANHESAPVAKKIQIQNDNLAAAFDLEAQIKMLGDSIQKLSSNIDLQLQDLEIMTKNMAQETLARIDF